MDRDSIVTRRDNPDDLHVRPPLPETSSILLNTCVTSFLRYAKFGSPKVVHHHVIIYRFNAHDNRIQQRQNTRKRHRISTRN